MDLHSVMKVKNFVHILRILSICDLFLLIKCNSDSNPENDLHFIRRFQQIDNNSEPNDIIARNNRISLRPTPAPGSLAQILLVDPNDPSQHPQPPLIFTSEHNPPEPAFSHINHNEEDSVILWSNNRLQLNRESEPGAPQSNRQPPFFVKVEHRSAEVSNTTSKNKNPDKASKRPDSMPGFEPQPLPPSTKPLDEKKECVVMGRGGQCFPFFPLENVFGCFRKGGIVAMDIVRCSWVRACCVENFFR